ncbi:MAG TPA: hypothetical protein VEO54_22440 [Thermoanaerobaculia bacterium]|nr:hypothetical protein [Thermoanaerobaculia bacterium]
MRIALLLAALLTTSTPADEATQLRLGGQAAVDALYTSTPSDLLDRVCAQKDCHTSRLFWYTDLAQAREAARTSGRRVISLHMLGRLDEELSCANSRFFRVMLYSDPEIAALMRERYVLHWHSVRPVPRVTIDMGDGRTIQQTITGNSVHYLLDADGTLLDALPGLHSPAAFRAQLEEWLALDRARLREYHAARAQKALKRGLSYGFEQVRESSVRRPTAQEATMRARSKARVERPLLSQLTIGLRPPAPERWTALAEEQGESVQFSKPSIELMQRKQPLTPETLDNLRRSVAVETIFNDVSLHRRVHEWFAAGEEYDLVSLNERIYAELFLSPTDDPWLGLDPQSAFAALPR